MSSTVRIFLSTELTRIPSSIRGILGENVNNTLCNGVTWLCAIWFLAYYCHNKIITTYLKSHGFSHYLRDRFSNSLWMFIVLAFIILSDFLLLGEYLTSDLLDLYRLVSYRSDDVKDVTPRLAVSHAIISAFFLFMAFNEGIRLNSPLEFVQYSALLATVVLAYELRLFQLYFTLIALLSFSGIFEELAKLGYSLIKCQFLFKLALIVFFVVHFIAIPGTVLFPIALTLYLTEASASLLFLFNFLFCWWSIVIYKSALFKLMMHWLHHDIAECSNNEDCKDQIIQQHCSGSSIECSLFAPRTDEAYMMALLRQEANQRHRRMIALRKPRGRGMLVQTLKCMMTIKKKLNERKFGKKRSDDSEDDSEIDVLIEEVIDETEDSKSGNVETLKRSGNITIFPADAVTINEENSEESELEVNVTYMDEAVDGKRIHREDGVQITDVTTEEEVKIEPTYSCNVETGTQLDGGSKCPISKHGTQNSENCGKGNGKTC